LNKPLIDLWKEIIYNPYDLIEKYSKLWYEQLDNPKEYYLNIREKFNKTGAPEFFLYLLVRCVKASV